MYCASVSARGAAERARRDRDPGQHRRHASSNRLRIVDWAQRHPEVADERIDAPLVVIGMFRAGTTFLSYLLEQDPRNRALLRWEAGDSVPPPTPADFRSGPRVEAARVGNDMLEQINPRIRAIHHEEPDGPTECITLMSQDFKSLSWEAISNVPTYGALAARGRSALGVRVPPARVPGAPERRRPRPLDAQEPAPRARTSRP